MGVQFKNNVSSTLAASLTNVATSLSVQPGAGVTFPAANGTTTFFWATLVKISAGAEVAREIIKVSNKATDVFTIVRAQEGTSALAFDAGDKISVRLTAGIVQKIADDLATAQADVIAAQAAADAAQTSSDGVQANLTAAIASLLASFIASTGAALVGYILNATGAFATTLQKWMRRKVYVDDFYNGDIISGVTDATAAIQAAIDSFTGPGIVNFDSRKEYVINGTGFNNPTDRVKLAFNGCRLRFAPTADNQVMATIAKASTVLFGCSMGEVFVYSNDTTHEKIAFDIIDNSGFTSTNISTMYPHWSGGGTGLDDTSGSKFFRIQGREMGAFKEIYIFADIPVLLMGIPAPHVASGIGVDHHNFHNCNLGSMSDNPPVTIYGGPLITDLSFTGFQAWISGNEALKWIDTTSSQVSSKVLLENVRWEQGPDATKYFLNIQHNTELQGLTLINCYADKNFALLRKVSNVLFVSTEYVGTDIALNVDSTVRGIEGVNCFWQAGSTNIMSGQSLIEASPKLPNAGALPPSFKYTPSANAARPYFGRLFRSGDADNLITATLNSFTVVLGGGSITTAAEYLDLGNKIVFNVTITPAGGATIASAIGTSNISGMPTVAVTDICHVINATTRVSMGVGTVEGAGLIYTPTWSATSGVVVISGEFRPT